MTSEFRRHEYKLINFGILKSYGSIQQVKNKDYVGTYGPRYMLDFIIMTCNVKYYKSIHDALELIDNYVNLNDSSFNYIISLDVVRL